MHWIPNNEARMPMTLHGQNLFEWPKLPLLSAFDLRKAEFTALFGPYDPGRYPLVGTTQKM